MIWVRVGGIRRSSSELTVYPSRPPPFPASRPFSRSSDRSKITSLGIGPLDPQAPLLSVRVGLSRSRPVPDLSLSRSPSARPPHSPLSFATVLHRGRRSVIVFGTMSVQEQSNSMSGRGNVAHQPRQQPQQPAQPVGGPQPGPLALPDLPPPPNAQRTQAQPSQPQPWSGLFSSASSQAQPATASPTTAPAERSAATTVTATNAGGGGPKQVPSQASSASGQAGTSRLVPSAAQT